jgi:hypothetical protein
MADCATCGTALKETARFCPRCGAAVEAKPEPASETAPGAPVASNRCASCGAELPGDARFCGECGSSVAEAGVPPTESDAGPDPATIAEPPIVAAEPDPDPAPSTTESPEQPVADSDPAISTVGSACASCGAELPDDALFCGECGTPVGSTGVPLPSGGATAQPATMSPRAPVAMSQAAPPQYGPPPYNPSPTAVPPTGYPAGPAIGGIQATGGQNPLNDFLAFRKLIVSPSVLQVAFWLAEALNAFLWIRYMVSGSFVGNYYGGPGTNGWNVVGGLLGLAAMALAIRVVLELALIVFRANGPEVR